MNALLRDTLRLIQDIVIEAKGSPLDREAVRRVEAVLERLAAGEIASPEGADYSQREATILFADLRGFSAIAAAYPTPLVLRVLSRCFGLMSEIIVRHYGTIDKFMGDAIMAVFHGHASPRDHAQRAVLAAVEMQIGMNELRQGHRDEGLPEIYIGIGISTGGVMSGLIGSDAYRAYTVIGEEVNTAARIEALSLRGQVLMSEATYEHCRGLVESGPPTEVQVKGRSAPIRVYEALGIPDLGKTVPRQDVRRSPRVAVSLPLGYHHLDGKRVLATLYKGTARDLSYHGAGVEIGEPLPLHYEIKLALELGAAGERVDDVYARVVNARAAGEGWRVGLEFTSLSDESSGKIRRLVQQLIQDSAPPIAPG